MTVETGISQILGFEKQANKDIANGYAGLDANIRLSPLIAKAPSANIRNSHDSDVDWLPVVYEVRKTITLTNGLLGAQRFLFDLRTENASTTAYGRIYRNGVALGTEQSTTSTVFVTKSQDITQNWAPGDTVELWVKTSNGLNYAHVNNFRIAYDDAPIPTVVSVNS
jgi:hypothetical protein